MKIKRIRISRFRSIFEADEELLDFNVMVGQNNHGKTNIFEAIHWFFKGYGRGETVENIRFCEADTNEPVSVELTFTGLQQAIDEMSNATKQRALRELLADSDQIIIRRNSDQEGGKKRELWVDSSETWQNPMGADGTWGDLLPALEYIHTSVRLSDVGGYKKSSPISEMLSGVLVAIIESNPLYGEFKAKFSELFGSDDSAVRVKLNEIGDRVQVYLQKQFPDGANVRFDVQNPVFDDLLKNFETEIDDGVVTAAEAKGDGMQRALMLSIVQAYADHRRESELARKFIFLIDEAELHLHPTAQRALKTALMEIAEQGEQVLVNTHSSVLVTDDAPQQRLFQVRKNAGRTSFSAIGVAEKQSIVFELLGGSPADLLLPRNFIIVEGRSDCEFLRCIIRRFYPEEGQGIEVLFAGGDIEEQERSLHAVHKMLVPITSSANPIYKERVVVLCDLPNDTPRVQQKYSQFRAGYPYLSVDQQLFILPKHSIEEYYPAPWTKNADEVREMTGPGQKVGYASEVANEITLQDFEAQMPVVADCIRSSIQLAF